MTELDPVSAARGALSGIKEGIKVGREIHETAKEVNDFLDEEAKARVAWKRKQQEIQRRGDMVFVDAVKEYRIIHNIRQAESQMYLDVEKEFGKKAVQEVKQLIVRLRKDHLELNDEMYRKRMQTRREWGVLLMLSLIIYTALKLLGVW